MDEAECGLHYSAEHIKSFLFHAVIIVPLNQFHAHLFFLPPPPPMDPAMQSGGGYGEC